ncbi:MAG: DegV family protein [Steroidobacterales bacterium]
MTSAAAVATALPILDGRRLSDALRAGIYQLFTRQEHLDKINVFPVPDGDTGTNMAMTLASVVGVLDRGPTAHAGQLLTQVADAAIDGARGNSGAILAQFFLGFGDKLGQLAELTARDFAEGAASAAQYARDAMTEPREGTILTVARNFAASLRADTEAGITDFATLLDRARASVRVAVDSTRSQLDELRRADVVDAGAQGLAEIVEGAADYLLTGRIPEPVAASASHDGDEIAAGSEIDVAHRYCTECTISGDALDRRRVREALAPLGSSLVVAGNARKLKIHIHADVPAAVFETLRPFGELSGQKADDMRRQQQLAHHQRNRGVAVVTDSAADIPEEELDRLAIHVVPVRVHFGNRSYLDKVGLTPPEFYRMLAQSPDHPKTSQPPPGDFRRAFEFLGSHFDAVISVNLTGRVSGTLAAAQTAAARARTHGKIHVIDSENASLGQGLVAMYAAECAAQGYDGEEIRGAVEAIVPKTRTFALLGRLDYAVRGGRVPRVVKILADLLHLTPVLMNRKGGRISARTAILGRRNLTQRFARLIRRRMHAGRRYRVAVGHGNLESAGRELLETIIAGLDNVSAGYLTTTGPALGVHGGPGMLVCALQEYETPRRKPLAQQLANDGR